MTVAKLNFYSVCFKHFASGPGYLMVFVVTPGDYEPPGFKAATSDNFTFENEPMNIKVGDVATV